MKKALQNEFIFVSGLILIESRNIYSFLSLSLSSNLFVFFLGRLLDPRFLISGTSFCAKGIFGFWTKGIFFFWSKGQFCLWSKGVFVFCSKGVF